MKKQPPVASNSGETPAKKIEDEEDELDDKDALEKEKYEFLKKKSKVFRTSHSYSKF